MRAACALVAFVIMLAPQHMLYDTLVPPVSWLLMRERGGGAGVLRGGADDPIGGIAHVRNATLFPVWRRWFSCWASTAETWT